MTNHYVFRLVKMAPIAYNTKKNNKYTIKNHEDCVCQEWQLNVIELKKKKGSLVP